MANPATLSAIIIALLLPNCSFAQYTKQADVEAKEHAQEIEEVNWYMNRTFWIAAKPKAPIRIEFFDSMPTQRIFSSGKFFVDKDTSFTVIDKFPEGAGSMDYIFMTIFKIKFSDGLEAFVRGDQLQRNTKVTLGHLSNGRGESYTMEYIYDEPPKKIKARLAALPKKSGVQIGMTANEVRASSWGAPKDINRTTTVNGVREQWVYSGGYLYLTNGVVTAIQN